ncbi:MAG: hypothetical protein R3Y26_01040 [Rikenellaceae bacterium]
MSNKPNRMTMSVRNAKVSLFFYFAMLVVNIVSRKLFIDYLGDTLTGLTTTMQYTVGLLNMADMGIVTAISCALFTPIYNDDKYEIQRIISLFNYLFKIVGTAIIAVGGILVFLMPLFIDEDIENKTIYLSFLTFLFTTSLSYFVNYKQQILMASQRTYVVTAIQNTVILCKIFSQMAIVYYVPVGEGAYYYWLLAEAVSALIHSLMIEIKVRYDYPWLKPSFQEGYAIRKEYKPLFKSLKQIVSHKFANVILTQTDSLVIANVISLVTVTYYYNYTMIISKLLTFVGSAFSGSWASVGNLISENDKEKIKSVFYQYNSIVMFLAGVLCLCVYLLADPFITAWIGEEYVLGKGIFVFMVVSLYVAIMRIPLTVFLTGYTLYKDTWSAWLEAGLNLVISIYGSIHYGLIGVVLGTTVSTFVVTFLWKPYFLYANGFKINVGGYYKEQAKFILPLLALYYLSNFYVEQYVVDNCNTLVDFFIFAVVLSVSISVVYGLMVYALSKSFRKISNDFLRRTFKR